MSEDNRSIFDDETPIPQDFYTLMNLTDWFWVCVIDLEYTLTSRFEQEWYGIAEIIIITPSLEVLGLMSVCLIGGWIE